MYIRWNRTKRSKKHNQNKGDLISAVLVESTRIGGKPRQRVISYLGSSCENLSYITIRWYFWQQVEKKLAGLELPEDDRNRIIQSIEKRFPKTTDEEMENEGKRLDEIIARIKAIS